MSLLIACAGVLSTGCVTGGKKNAKRTKPTTEVAKKPGSKEKAPAGQQPQVAAKPEVPPPPSIEQQLKFFKTHVIPESAFGEDDVYFLSTVPASPDAGSVSEAVITIGILRSVINPVGSVIKPTFAEEDLVNKDATQEPEAERTGPSVEKMFKEKNVDLADALAENPLLGTFSVASMVRQALSLGVDSPDYQAEIVNILKKTTQKWADLNRSFGGETNPAPEAEATPEPKLMTDTYGNVYDANAPKNGDESTITDAQRLADAGRFQDAIKLASSVGSGHPSYPLAQEKIKDYSNKAVQNLRKKAAAAFQSAMPITDAKVRAQYLRQAKSFLEEALKNYPQATQLPTVRDNLRIISRDLEKLESEAGG
jgi:hypothetical protein